MKGKKLSSLVLAGTMAATMLAGCGSSTPAASSDAASSSAASTTSSTAAASSSAEEAVTSQSTTSSSAAPASQKVDKNLAKEAMENGWDKNKNDEIVVSVINGYYTAGEQKLAEDYMKEHPETKVTIDVVADNDSYTTKLQTQVTSGITKDSPDIIHSNFLKGLYGGYPSAFSSGVMVDLESILDENHPYQDGKVRDMFQDSDLQWVLSDGGGAGMPYLPFDKCGVSFYYNEDVFKKEGMEAPTSWEDLLADCEKLRNDGYDTPIAVSQEASWLLSSLADAGYRDQEADYLIQPGDALWNPDTMAVNKDFKFDENNLSCDLLTIQSDERIAAANANDSIHSDISKAAWSAFHDIAQYFPQNYVNAGSNSLSDFETGVSPIMLNGSWNVGAVLADMKQMPEDSQFDWGTFNIPSFKNPPKELNAKLRGLFVFGNQMGIVSKADNLDHEARVIDFLLYWYSKEGAKTCYEETLNSGNFVQGPCVIDGVTLSDEINDKLKGFEVDGTVKQFFQQVVGFDSVTEADKASFNDILNQYIDNEIDEDSFLDQLQPLVLRYVDSLKQTSGFDLDPKTADTPASGQ